MCGPSQRGSRLIGGESVRMWGFPDRFRCGTQARLTTKVPRVLIACMRSYRLISRASVPDRLIAEALLTQMSIPPKRSTACATARDLCLVADVADDRQRTAARRLDLLGRRVHRSLELGVRLARLGDQGDIGAVARRPDR